MSDVKPHRGDVVSIVRSSPSRQGACRLTFLFLLPPAELTGV